MRGRLICGPCAFTIHNMSIQCIYGAGAANNAGIACPVAPVNCYMALPFTCSVWVRLDRDLVAGESGYVVRAASLVAPWNCFYIVCLYNAGTNNRIECYVVTTGGVYNASQSTPISSGVWHHIVFLVTSPGKVLNHYIDNVMYSWGVVTADIYQPGANGVFVIGSNALADADSFKGRIEDLRYYNRELSVGEISTLYYSRGHDPVISGLRSRWMIRERGPGQAIGGASTVKDTGQLGNHGAKTGAAAPTYDSGILSFRRPYNK